MTPEPHIRRELRPGDLEALVAHHRRVYARDYGVDSSFADHVAASVARVAGQPFPTSREAICLVELDGEHVGQHRPHRRGRCCPHRAGSLVPYRGK